MNAQIVHPLTRQKTDLEVVIASVEEDHQSAEDEVDRFTRLCRIGYVSIGVGLALLVAGILDSLGLILAGAGLAILGTLLMMGNLRNQALAISKLQEIDLDLAQQREKLSRTEGQLMITVMNGGGHN